MVRLLGIRPSAFEAFVALQARVCHKVLDVGKITCGEGLCCVEDEVLNGICEGVKHHVCNLREQFNNKLSLSLRLRLSIGPSLCIHHRIL